MGKSNLKLLDKMENRGDKSDNRMREIRVDKLVLNLCTGEAGDKITKANKVLSDLSNQTPVESKAKYTVRSFGIRRGEKIAVSVTVRGERAEELIKRGLRVKEYELRKKNFSNTGNFGFGIEEHIDLGIKYDTNTGIFGMDFYVVLTRAGRRVSRKKRCRSRIGNFQKISAEDAKAWFVETYGGNILN